MRKFYQNEWLNIPFNSFAELNHKIIAAESFYDAFYNEFFKKYNGFDALPKNWINEKEKVVQLLHQQVQDEKKYILSIGCGLGYVEKRLAENWLKSAKKLVAIEPSKTASRWIVKNSSITLLNGYFPECLTTDQHYDFAYSSAIEYIFDDSEYLNFLKSIKEYGINDFMIISASYEDRKIEKILKDTFYQLLEQFGIVTILQKTGLRKTTQFWGYLRTFEDHSRIFKKAGFKNIEYGMHDLTVPWIRGQIIG